MTFGEEVIGKIPKSPRWPPWWEWPGSCTSHAALPCGSGLIQNVWFHSSSCSTATHNLTLLHPPHPVPAAARRPAAVGKGRRTAVVDSRAGRACSALRPPPRAVCLPRSFCSPFLFHESWSHNHFLVRAKEKTVLVAQGVVALPAEYWRATHHLPPGGLHVASPLFIYF